MSDKRRATVPLTWPKAALFIAAAVACFHLAYWPTNFWPLHLGIFGYVICVTQLSRMPTTRQAYYAGLITGVLCVAPQLTCFWKIFSVGAVALYYILGCWIGIFTATTSASLRRFGPIKTAILIPFLWMGLEYFRSELYYLKFSWMNVGYALAPAGPPLSIYGMYAVGLVAAIYAAAFLAAKLRSALIITGALTLWCILNSAVEFVPPRNGPVRIAGVQMEFPVEADIPRALDAALAEHTNADIFVLSEYTLNSTEYTSGGPIPKEIKNWCRKNQRYLVIGGKDPAPKNNYYDTAFVVGTNGEIVFRQGKSVPIQFFKDGLPAPKQEVWDSPWGKIGFCVCYDLSYTRVIDGLINKGAQLIIVPTMDVIDWGKRQHELHALVAPVRAAEYHVPIFRVASSGISQAVDHRGRVVATAPFAGEGKALFASLRLPDKGSLPLDRYLAPVAVAMTATVLLWLNAGKLRKKPNAPAASDSLENKSEASVVR
jgi:apolipoprotein N-acyltransferase